MFEKKSICVIGIGTIGSLIVEYLRKKRCQVIRVFCNDEDSLFKAKEKWGNDNMRYLLGDIRDYRRVLQALRDIDYVFNAAAIKHVPIAEENPMDAVKTNIIGLDNVIEACIVNGVKKLLHISTDKAVEPTTLMGATKLVGEKVLLSRWEQNIQVNMNIVRLGNILESRGSFMKIFEECKAKGKPVPITDKRMERFFMTQDELITFIMKVFKVMNGGSIFIPKMETFKLMDLVGDYPIKEIGIRKGEKLTEKLLSEYEEGIAEDKGDYSVII